MDAYQLKEDIKICHYCGRYIEQNPTCIVKTQKRFYFHKRCSTIFLEKLYSK